MHKIVAFVTATLLAGAAWAAQSPGQKCETGKNQEAGKYSACLHKAEARLLKTKGACSVSSGTVCYGDEDCPALETCNKDLAKYGIAVQKCEAKFEAKWNKLSQTASDKGDPCPDGLQQADVKAVIGDCVANVASGLAGDGLTDCSGDLAQCSGDLGTCNTDLGTCSGSLTTCTTDLGTAQGQVATCSADLVTCNADLGSAQTDLTTCEGDLATAQACGNGSVDAGEACDQSDLNGATCVDEGFAGGMLRCGADCVYDTSGCYAERFVDNGDGTITDNDTGLMWEKKVKQDAATDLANLQDANNRYVWMGTCSLNWNNRCQPDASASAACFAGVEGNPFGCDECPNGDGPCAGGMTIWRWLNDLNAANYGGHNDWRVPKIQELQTIADFTTASPAIGAAFDGASCGASCSDVTDPACSCTPTDLFWSATAPQFDQTVAWYTDFNTGMTLRVKKDSSVLVRAVRGGE